MNNKSLGYDIKSGRKLLKTDTFKNFTNNGKHRTGYERKKKTKKTQQTQYAEDDNHPFHTNATGNGGVVPRVDFVIISYRCLILL